MDAILSKSYKQKIATDDLSSSVALGVWRSVLSVSPEGASRAVTQPLSELLYITKIHEILYYDEFKTFELYRYIGIYNINDNVD